MPILSWKEEFSVGVKKIDDEHKTLVDIINNAYDSVESREEEDVLLELTNKMRKYAMTHFATEERLMDKYEYPYAESHKKEHSDFMIKAASPDNMLGSEDKEIEPTKVFKYLADWLREHILKTDKKLGDFLTSNTSE